MTAYEMNSAEKPRWRTILITAPCLHGRPALLAPGWSAATPCVHNRELLQPSSLRVGNSGVDEDGVAYPWVE